MLKRTLEWCCGTLAATALFAIMALTLADVTGRKLASHSLPGAVELTEMLMVVVIFAALPLVSLRGEHVVFDSLDPWMPAWLRRVQRGLVHLLCTAALGGAAWLMWVKAGQVLAYGDESAQLKIAQAPFVYGMSLLCALTAAVHLGLLFNPAGGPSDKPDAPDEVGVL